MEDETDAGSGGEEKGMNDVVSHVFKEFTVTLPVIMARLSYYEANCMFGTVCSTFGSDHRHSVYELQPIRLQLLKERSVLKQEVRQVRRPRRKHSEEGSLWPQLAPVIASVVLCGVVPVDMIVMKLQMKLQMLTSVFVLQEKELKMAADSVLCEVRKKQADVKRMQDILRSLEKLRRLRREAVSKKGESRCMELDALRVDSPLSVRFLIDLCCSL